ncbi:collagen alpha-1(I) chain-like [Haliaeetus albicilla]|uniref:collagen alpha-1(I) chain-like n=1 Tax=Haliaeetus albicilla TaxID=8969 RepID=UPI0037E80004
MTAGGFSRAGGGGGDTHTRTRHTVSAAGPAPVPGPGPRPPRPTAPSPPTPPKRTPPPHTHRDTPLPVPLPSPGVPAARCGRGGSSAVFPWAPTPPREPTANPKCGGTAAHCPVPATRVTEETPVRPTRGGTAGGKGEAAAGRTGPGGAAGQERRRDGVVPLLRSAPPSGDTGPRVSWRSGEPRRCADTGDPDTGHTDRGGRGGFAAPCRTPPRPAASTDEHRRGANLRLRGGDAAQPPAAHPRVPAPVPRAGAGGPPPWRAGGGDTSRGRGVEFSLRLRRGAGAVAEPRPRNAVSPRPGEAPPGRLRAGRRGPAAPPAPLRSHRPAEPPAAPRAALPPGSPGGGRGRRGGLRRFLAVPPSPPPHGRIQRAPPSSHFLQLRLHRSSAGRRGRAAAQPGGVPRPAACRRHGRPEPGRAVPGAGRAALAGLAVTIPPFPRHFVTVLAFSQSRDRAGALGTGPRCAGAGGPHGPGPRSPPPPRRRTWERGRSRDPRPPPAPSHRLLPTGIAPLPFAPPRTQQPRVVADWVHAGPSHAGPAPVSGPLSPGERARSAVTSLPSRRAGDAGPVASLRPPHGYRKCPDGREGGDDTVPSGRVRPGAGVARYSVLQPCPVPVAVPAPRGTSPNALAGSPWGPRWAVRGPREVGRPVGADSPVSSAGTGGAGEGGGRDEPRGCAGGRGDGRAGRRMPRRGGPVPSTRAGTVERRRQRPAGGHSGWVRVPRPTAAFPGRGESPVARRGRPERAGGCPVRTGAKRGGAGPLPGLGLRSRAAAEGGEGRGEGGGSCSAAMQRRAESRARRPGGAPPLQQCRCEHRAAPGRTGPGIPCPTGPPPAPTAPSFGSLPLSRPRFVFLPLLPGRRDVSSRCPRDLPLAHYLPRRGGPHPSPGAGGPAATPAATLVLSTPRLLAAAPPDAGTAAKPPVLHRFGAGPRAPPCSAPASPGGNCPLPTLPPGRPPGPPTLAVVRVGALPRPRSRLPVVPLQTALRVPRGTPGGGGGSHLRSPSPRLASDTWTRTAGTRNTAAACGSTREGGPPRRSPLPRTLLGSGCPAGRYPEVSVCGGVRARLPVKRSISLLSYRRLLDAKAGSPVPHTEAVPPAGSAFDFPCEPGEPSSVTVLSLSPDPPWERLEPVPGGPAGPRARL